MSMKYEELQAELHWLKRDVAKWLPVPRWLGVLAAVLVVVSVVAREYV